MRSALFILAIIFLTGCATKPTAITPATSPTAASRYDDATSAALVFDPPVAASDPQLDLSRDERQPSAFVSFDGPTTTYFWIHTDDLQDSDWNNGLLGGSRDRYQRRAVSEKTGVTYR